MRYNGCLATCEVGQKRATKPANSSTPDSEKINIHVAPGKNIYFLRQIHEKNLTFRKNESEMNFI